jgi:uncharacterized protein (TIGR03435 family)
MFDAASVKAAGLGILQPITGGPGTNDPGRFRAPRIDMLTLLSRAFDVSTDQIVGPSWTRDAMYRNDWNNYAIDAAIPPNTTPDQFHQMLQNLLVERFHLVFHHETRGFPGYELVVDKGGPKFKEVTPDPNAPPPDARALVDAPKGADGFADVRGSRVMSGGNVRTGQRRDKYQEQTMAQFVSNLGFRIGASKGKGANDGYLQPRVVDKTGLTGKYTFILEHYNQTMANLFAQVAPAVSGAQSPPAASDPGEGPPDIFTAIQKQLGLRLDKVAAVPLDMIVVDSVDKVPTAN